MTAPIRVEPPKDGKLAVQLGPVPPVRLTASEALRLRDDLDTALHELVEDS
jgi:hypothetical protein